MVAAQSRAGKGAANEGLMSTLGHKQTFAAQNGMSALPPKADMCGALAHVRFVPIADIGLLIVKIGTGRPGVP
jgi:hypothetical protein